MAKDRTTSRQGGKKTSATARPTDPKVVKLTVRMTAQLRWRIRAYAAAHEMDVDDLVIGVVEREMAGWYTARRGGDPLASRPDADGEAPPVRLADDGEPSAADADAA